MKAIWTTIPHFRARKRTFHDECAFGALVLTDLIPEYNVSNGGLTDFFGEGGLWKCMFWTREGLVVVASETPVSFSMRFPRGKSCFPECEIHFLPPAAGSTHRRTACGGPPPFTKSPQNQLGPTEFPKISKVPQNFQKSVRSWTTPPPPRGVSSFGFSKPY